jgi:hypothetical protein
MKLELSRRRIPIEAEIEHALRPLRDPYREMLRSLERLSPTRDATARMLEQLARSSKQLDSLSQQNVFASATRMSAWTNSLQSSRFDSLRLLTSEMRYFEEFKKSLTALSPVSSLEQFAKQYDKSFIDATGDAFTTAAAAFLNPAFVAAVDFSYGADLLESDWLPPDESALDAELQTGTHAAATAAVTGDYSGLLGWIERIKRQHPNAYVAFLIFYALFVSPVGELIVQQGWERFRAPKAVVAREVAKKIPENVAREWIAERSFVTTSHLMVRECGARQCRKRGTLYQGDVVRVLKWSRSWSLIEYTEDGLTVRGWVFCKYLAKLRSPSNTRSNQ